MVEKPDTKLKTILIIQKQIKINKRKTNLLITETNRIIEKKT